MHKFTRLTTLAMFGTMVLGAAGCSNTKYDLELWHNFGAGYTDKFNKSLTEPVQKSMGKDIKAQSKGSYDGILESITKTLSTRDFPNIATGYPDHLSTYAKSGYPASPTGVLLNLNDFLDDEALNAEHKAKTGYTFREDYYPEYMIENDTICYITQYGDKFHYRDDCPLMTAYVTKIPKESIENYNLRPCFKCAKEKE